MNTTQSPSALPVSEYQVLLKTLHDLMAEGKGDSDEAEAVRDKLDELWPRLTEEEVDFLRGLSSDLYMLTSNEIYSPYAGTQAQLRADLQAAYVSHDYHARLRLLRKSPTFLTPYGLAFLRARAYEELDHLDIALLFMRHAVNLNPRRDLYKLFVLDLLRKSGQYDQVLAQTDTYVEQGASLELRIQAADVLYLSATQLPLYQAEPFIERAVELLRQCLLQDQSVQSAPAALVADGYITLGACFVSQLQPDKAIEAFNKALEIEPNNEWALDALQTTFTQKSVAVRLQSSHGEPYRGGRELFSLLDMAA